MEYKEYKPRAEYKPLPKRQCTGCGNTFAAHNAVQVQCSGCRLFREPLTPSEQRVFERMARGPTNKELAIALRTSESMVKFTISVILDKLGISNRTKLAVYAFAAERHVSIEGMGLCKNG